MTESVSGAKAAIPAHDARADYLSGVMLILLGTLAFSSAGLFVRMIGKDAATILFWRGLFTVIAITGFVWWRERERTLQSFLAIGWPGVWIAALSAASMWSFIASLQTTTVANNSIIFGTSPFITAGLAWLLIRERPSAPTLVCSIVALAGALLVMGSSFRLSGAAVVGDALAVLMTVSFAIKTVLVRQHREVPMVPAACVGALMGSVGAIPFVQEWSLSAGEIAQFALFGFTQQGAGLILTTLAMARIPAAHAALLMAFDLPLSPLWVWMAYGERPTLLGLIGGLVVLTAIIAHVILEGRRRR